MTPGNPTSWRDVYALVQDSEKRLTATITDGFARQAQVSQDHEVRIRVLEANDQRDGATNRTTVTAISVSRQVFIALLAAGSLLVSLVALLTR